jgi:predicted enzyme related to lactoylglutathione lyase
MEEDAVDNPVVHFEINGTDGQALEKFYSEVFGWHVQSFPELGYATIDTHAGAGINGGIGTAQEGQPPYVTFYVENPDPEATLARAESLGATTVMPVTEIGVAKYGQFRDPQGNVLGVVAPAEGPGVSVGDGVAVDWFEILGPDASALRAFYSQLFGWDLHGDESAEWKYYHLDPGTDRGIGGGVGGSQDGQPHVTPYAQVDDFATYLERAEALGGGTATSPTEASGTTFAQLRDPQGLLFGLWKPAE